jgi:hypothetical protein
MELETSLSLKDIEINDLQGELRLANRKIYTLSRSVNPQCLLDRVPDELMYRIMSYTCISSLVNFSMTSKYIYACSQESFLWKMQFSARWGERRLAAVQMEMDIPITADGNSVEYSLTNTVSKKPQWREVYMTNKLLDYNWRHNRGKVHDCKGHCGTITCLFLSNEKLISGSNNYSITMI